VPQAALSVRIYPDNPLKHAKLIPRWRAEGRSEEVSVTNSSAQHDDEVTRDNLSRKLINSWDANDPSRYVSLPHESLLVWLDSTLLEIADRNISTGAVYFRSRSPVALVFKDRWAKRIVAQAALAVRGLSASGHLREAQRLRRKVEGDIDQLAADRMLARLWSNYIVATYLALSILAPAAAVVAAETWLAKGDLGWRIAAAVVGFSTSILVYASVGLIRRYGPRVVIIVTWVALVTCAAGVATGLMTGPSSSLVLRLSFVASVTLLPILSCSPSAFEQSAGATSPMSSNVFPREV
jgi:hypothetical protein